MAEPALARDLLPEDAYDGDDPFPLRLVVLERTVASIMQDHEGAQRVRRVMSALELVDKLGAELDELVARIAAARARLED
jgi:aspartate/tyrosine/aromatic aminotransferase